MITLLTGNTLANITLAFLGAFLIHEFGDSFNINKKFERTQDLKKVQEMVYSLMMWKTSSFLTSMAKKKRAILHGKYDYYPVGKLSSFIVKNSEDLK